MNVGTCCWVSCAADLSIAWLADHAHDVLCWTDTSALATGLPLLTCAIMTLSPASDRLLPPTVLHCLTSGNYSGHGLSLCRPSLQSVGERYAKRESTDQQNFPLLVDYHAHFLDRVDSGQQPGVGSVFAAAPALHHARLAGGTLSECSSRLQSASAECVLHSSFRPPRLRWPDRRAWLISCPMSVVAYMDVDPVTILRYIEKHPAESRKLLSRVGDEDVDSIAVLITNMVQAALEQQAGPQQKVTWLHC